MGRPLFLVTRVGEAAADWKEQPRSPFLSNSTCGSFVSTSGPESSARSRELRDTDLESIYTFRSSFSAHGSTTTGSTMGGRTRSRTRSLQSLRVSMPVLEDRDYEDMRGSVYHPIKDVDESEDLTASTSASACAAAAASSPSKMFASATIRVWKQTPLPNWMNVFMPRYVSLQSGPHPYLEYARHKDGPMRQRVYLTSAVTLERQPKNKLLIEFNSTGASSDSYTSAMETKSHSRCPVKDSSHPSSSNLCSRHGKWLLRFENKQERDQWAKKIQDAVDLLGWISKFTVGNIVMDSDASTVAEAFTWQDEELPSHVMKVMRTESKKSNQNTRNEIQLHHLLTNFSSHPNVLTLHDSFRQQERAYLVMEYCAGGDLFTYLAQEGAMDEAAAQLLFQSIVAAIKYVHGHNIVHLDIKPENLLFKTSPLHWQSMKLADFGSAQLITDATRPKPTLSCTVGYAAPEVLLNGEVSFAADIFSAGVVLYTMLCGYTPFQAASDDEAIDRTLKGNFSFAGPGWDGVSMGAKDLICGMLDVDPKSRMNMNEVLDHAWMK